MLWVQLFGVWVLLGIGDLEVYGFRIFGLGFKLQGFNGFEGFESNSKVSPQGLD